MKNLRTSGWRTLANVVGYQLVWIACVGGAGLGFTWSGPIAASAFVILTLTLGGRRDADWRALAVVVPLGFATDSLFAASGLLSYSPAWPGPALAPLWIGSLWAAFAMTLNHSLAFLGDRLWLGSLLGLLGGPLAYWTASGTFEAVDFGVAPALALSALALAWAALLPLLMLLNSRLSPARRTLA